MYLKIIKFFFVLQKNECSFFVIDSSCIEAKGKPLYDS